MQADARRSNTLTSGHRACQGCGEALGARYVLDAAMRATDGRLIAANATGCLEVFSTPYPESSWQLPWIHSLFGNAPAVATGVAAALKAKGRNDIRVDRPGRRRRHRRHRLRLPVGHVRAQRRRALRLLRQRGLHEHRRAALRRDAARRAHRRPRKPVGEEPGNAFGQGKNAPLIAMAHEIPYVATATVADLHDLEAKVERAMELRGARYLHVLVTCPLGWGTAPSDSIRIARLATQTGLFPVFEAEHGEVIGVSKIRRPVPVEEYLRPQRRFAHLFGARAATDVIAASRRAPTATSRASGSTTPRTVRVMDKPFAITLDVGSSLANKTGSWRTERPVYVRPAAAVQPRLPGRRERPGLALPRRGGRRLRARLAQDHGGQPAARGDGPGLLPPVRDRLQPRPARRGGRHQLRRAVPRRRGDPQRLDRRGRRAADRQARARRRRRPVRACRPPTTWRGSATPSTIHDAGPQRRRHDALRHPALPAAARRPRRRDPADPRPRASTLELDTQGRRLLDGDARRRLRRRLPRRRRAHRQARVHPRRQRRARCSTPSRVLRSMEGEEQPLLGRRVAVYGGGNTAMDAARTAQRLGAEEAIVVYRRTRDRMPAHDSELEEAEEEGVLVKWLSTIKHADGGSWSLERMELDETGFPQPTGELEELEADSLVLALGQEADLSLLDGVPGHRGRRRRRPGRTGPDDRPPGRLRRRRHGARRAHGHGRRSATASRPPRSIDAWLRGERVRAAARARLADFDDAQHLVLRRRAAHRAAAARARPPRSRRSTRSSAASTRRTRCSRRAAACRAATASPATTATASAPTTR